MSIEELASRYSEMCDGQDDCDFCEYNNGDCLMKFSYTQAIDEFAESLLKELVPMKDKKFDIARGTAMPERYIHLKLMDILDTVIEMVKIKAEQLKEGMEE